jgi:hypothetical protein
MQKLSKETIANFGLTEDDLNEANGAVKHRYNHVRQNIKLASKFTIIKNLQQTFKKTVLAKNNPQNLVLIQSSNDEKQEVKRQQLLQYQRRWDCFRERRDQVQELYSELRKKQALVDILTRQMLLHQFLLYLSNNYAIAQYKKEKRMMAQFLTLKIKHMLQRRQRRWNMKRDNEFTKKTRFFCTVLGNAFQLSIEKRAKVVLADFLQRHIQREKIKIQGRAFFRKIIFMQARMRRQLEIRYSKVEVLLTAWEHVAAAIMRKASKRKDQAVLQLLQDIALLDSKPAVKRQLMLRYVNKCRELHSIAFL